jgi:hypothetical protein
MKTIKIILPIALIAVLGFFILRSSVTVTGSTKVRPPENLFTARIENDIDSLSKTDINTFCNKFYAGIKNRIAEFHSGGHFGNNNNPKDNTQWQEILSKDLYSAYALKFAQQAFNIFDGSEWKIADINFIRREVNTLRNSSYLEQGTSADSSFKNIHTILSKYDEIGGFISSCNNFAYSNYEIATSFPRDDVSSKIQRSKTYISNRLDNKYVSNCARLNEGLSNIPKNLFNKHISYLRSKIVNNSNRFREFPYQTNYSEAIYTPLKNQIKELDNSLYNISDDTFNSNYESLYQLLTSDNSNAFQYFSAQNNNN